MTELRSEPRTSASKLDISVTQGCLPVRLAPHFVEWRGGWKALPQENGSLCHETQPLTDCRFMKEWTCFPIPHHLPKAAENRGSARKQKKASFLCCLFRARPTASRLYLSRELVLCTFLQKCIVPIGLSASTIKRLCYCSWSKVSG